MGREMYVVSVEPSSLDWQGVDEQSMVAWVDHPSLLLSIRHILPKEVRGDFDGLSRIGDYGSYTDELQILSADEIKPLVEDLDRFLRIRAFKEFNPSLSAAHIKRNWDAHFVGLDVSECAANLRDTLAEAAENSHWFVSAL